MARDVIRLPYRVADPNEVLKRLRDGGFRVRNVGVDKRATHIYLEPEETKDPVAFLENRVQKDSIPVEVAEKVVGKGVLKRYVFGT